MWLLHMGPSSRELGADCGELLRGFTEEQSRFLGLPISDAHCVHKPYRPSFLPSPFLQVSLLLNPLEMSVRKDCLGLLLSSLAGGSEAARWSTEPD